ncbi:biliverdin-producing heme oxygenase [Pseudomonas sp. JDS28PS106]|uniref:biliverdin-producing heme oxygenase n=1 Tax=Pseudomonas sp. JDS28PS106 TaxID=2497235 RepID=UPI002FD21B3F
MSATFTPDSAPVLLQALRTSTGQSHVRLEKRMPFFTPSLDAALYRRLLEAYYGFYRPLETALVASGLMPASLMPEERMKTPALVADLEALGLSDVDILQLPHCEQLPVIDSPGACLGVMYVLEGATLGGQLLRREVHARIGLDEHSGARFLDVYGATTGKRWKAFLNHLQVAPRDPRAIEAAALAAQSTFTRFEHWLDARKVLS